MCTSGSADILVVATVLGSLILYDLKNMDSNPTNDLNYNGLLETQVQGWAELPVEK